jgi:hypothetical protein
MSKFPDMTPTVPVLPFVNSSLCDLGVLYFSLEYLPAWNSHSEKPDGQLAGKKFPTFHTNGSFIALFTN